MPFVNVRLVAPDGRRYRVEVDADLNVETVKSQLVQKLQMPTDRRYTLLLVDSFTLSAGDELQLIETQEQGVRGLELDE